MTQHTIHRGTDLSPEFMGLELQYLMLAVMGAAAGFIAVMLLSAAEAGVAIPALVGSSVVLGSYLSARRLEASHRRTSTTIHTFLASRRYPSDIVSTGSARTIICRVQLRIRDER